jgi:NHS family xanthosine MFS transporter
MKLKFRLAVMLFLQFFLWGAWLITLGAYTMEKLNFDGAAVGAIFATQGIAAIFMPGLCGILADRWINAERVYGALHLLGAAMLFLAARATTPTTMYWIMLVNSLAYMPTLGLANTVSYSILEQKNYDIVTTYPPIRVWGTIGFIAAMWTVSLCHFELSNIQLYIASGAALMLGLYCFTLPACPPHGRDKKTSLASAFGLDAFKLFKQRKMAIFFIFAMLLGAALQITNTFGDTFLHDFSSNPFYKDKLAVRYPAILMSVSQMSETLFILAIPFFLRRFGIKKVMLMSMFAWVFRFGLFDFGNPGSGLWMLILSMIVYGCAFDFFNISGSLFVESETEPHIRASAQGLFIIMTNGLGAYIGGTGSGWVVDHFTHNGVRDWHSIWMTFASYALVIAVLFAIFFRYKHEPQKFAKA